MRTFPFLLSSCLVFVFVFGLLGCAIENPNSWTNEPNADQRWPEKGIYGYDYSYGTCRDKREFPSKAAYCLGLTDASLNKSCTLEQRKKDYRLDCGNDFKERNIPAGSREPSSSRGGSTWPPLPSQPSPLPPTGTVGGPDSGSDTSRRDRESVVRNELEAAGLRFSIVRPHPTDPQTELFFNEQLQRFWFVLKEMKHELLARKADLHVIILTDSVSYDSEYKFLRLHVAMTNADLYDYFRLFDRKRSLTSSSQIRFDLGPEYLLGSPLHTLEIEKRLSFFQQRLSTLQSLYPAVQVIRFADKAAYELDSGNTRNTLQLHEGYFESEFDRYAPALAEAAPFLRFAGEVGLGVRGKPFPIEQGLGGFAVVARELWSLRGDLKAIIDLSSLREIEFFFTEDLIPRYFARSQRLVVPVFTRDRRPTVAAIQALASQAALSKSLGLKISWSTEELGPSFVDGIERIEAREAVIRKKKHAIDEIYLTDSSAYLNRTLWIGTKDSPADLDRVLTSIR